MQVNYEYTFESVFFLQSFRKNIVTKSVVKSGCAKLAAAISFEEKEAETFEL